MNHYSLLLPTLLPEGLRDVMHPDAAHERYVINTILDRFSLFGYEQVSPPLMEYETSLLSGKGEVYHTQSFRVMDAQSQTMMALRADITTQIERIAGRLLQHNNIARLSYTGNILRSTAPHGLASGRQLRQTGIEMIGDKADPLEILTASLEALDTLKVTQLVITLSVAGLLEQLCSHVTPQMRKAIYNKDSDALDNSISSYHDIVALLKHDDEQYSQAVKEALQPLHNIKHQIETHFENAIVIVDPLDTENFPYHHGICFTLLDSNTKQEIGRGGSYDYAEDRKGCGLTLYMEKLMQSDICYPNKEKTHIISDATPYAQARQLREQSIKTIKEIVS